MSEPRGTLRQYGQPEPPGGGLGRGAELALAGQLAEVALGDGDLSSQACTRQSECVATLTCKPIGTHHKVTFTECSAFRGCSSNYTQSLERHSDTSSRGAQEEGQ